MKSVLLIALLALPLASRADVISPNETPAQRAARIKARDERFRQMLEEQKRAAEEAKHPKPKPVPKPPESHIVDPDLQDAIAGYARPLMSMTAIGLIAIALLFIRRRRPQP